jgi:hypothetical protein
VTEIPYPAPVLPISPSGRRVWDGPLRSSLVSQDVITTSGSARLLTAHRVGFSASALYRAYPPERDRTPPAQDAIRPPWVMLPSVRPCRPHPRLIPPGGPPGTPSSSSRRVGTPGVCADRIAQPLRLRLRPGRLPQVLRIPPRDGHPTFLGYRPYPFGRAGLSPARGQHCQAHAN